MTRSVAFLRAVNVGGRTVSMETLRELFRGLGHTNVETFIASGNVIFESRSRANALEAPIEDRLRERLGYEVTTCVRTMAELRAVIALEAFTPEEVQSAGAFNIAFLKTAPATAALRALRALESPVDRFRVEGREVYWLCQLKQSQSTFSNAVLERTLGVRSTIRGVSTLTRLAEKYGGGRPT